MLWHLLGWATVASQVGLGGWLMHYLWHADYKPSWAQDLPIPKVIGEVHLSSGSDYVGYV